LADYLVSGLAFFGYGRSLANTLFQDSTKLTATDTSGDLHDELFGKERRRQNVQIADSSQFPMKRCTYNAAVDEQTRSRSTRTIAFPTRELAL